MEGETTAETRGRLARTPSKRRLLWGAFLAVFVPLLVLLALQYSWLTDLERTSAIAMQAKAQSHLKRVTKEVQWFYVSTAERVLNPSATLLEPKYKRKLAWFFKKRGIEGASRVFVVTFQDRSTSYLLYDPPTHQLLAPEGLTPEVQAILMAAAPWAVLRKKGVALEREDFSVEERRRGHRMILNPITDEDSKLVGLAGLIVDQDYFLNHVLPRAVEDALPAASPGNEVVVVVRDGDGHTVWPEDPGTVTDGEVTRPFSFLFTDWKLALRGRTSTPEQWARANFAFNVTLSLALGVVLLGGLALVLRTMAREMRLSEMKNDFVSNVSHELRTPLASIRVFGELLRLGRVSSPEKTREYGEYIETESRRLTQLINNILDFSRIESGGRDYELEPADLEEIVADVIKTFEIRLRRSGFRIEVQGPSSPLPEIRVDRDAIRQALFNLLDNAVKYSGDGREIVVRLGRRDGRAVVAVRDHGIGISRQEQQKIFERFHRVGTGLVHDVKGTGLGLAIVRHIVRAHDGEVSIDSELGAGSTFSIHLPITPAEPAGSTLPSSEEGELRLQQTG